MGPSAVRILAAGAFLIAGVAPATAGGPKDPFDAMEVHRPAQGLEMIGVSLCEKGDAIREFGEDFGRRVVGRIRGECDWSTPEARRLVERLLGDGR